jgi:hypothetical protein
MFTKFCAFVVEIAQFVPSFKGLHVKGAQNQLFIDFNLPRAA